MQVLLKKETRKPVEIIDGSLIETETPTLFTDRATIKSIKKSSNLHDAAFGNDEYELKSAMVYLDEGVYNGKPDERNPQIKEGMGIKVTAMGDIIVIHNSFDGREGVEFINRILDSVKK